MKDWSYRHHRPHGCHESWWTAELSVAGTDYGWGISWLREFENKGRGLANIKFQRIKMKKRPIKGIKEANR